MNGKEPAQVRWTKRFAPFKTETITRPKKIEQKPQNVT